MPGRWITNQQVMIYMNARKELNSQQLAAAKAGISERSGREIEKKRRDDPKQVDHNWRTRPDPFGEVWESEIVPMLQEHPALQPITLLEYLQEKYPGHYPDAKLRTLQRRVKQWLALSGPEKEVMFRQQHLPGQQGLSDFTHLKDVVITIRGEPLKHMLYHFRLAYSHWSYMRVILGGESFIALSEGLQEALCRLNGAPAEHRTDSLSAAYKNLSKEAQEDITQRYESMCSHYSMKPTRNNPGASHENGSIESPHGHLKRRIKQALLLRGNYDFDSIADYQHFIDGVVKSHNNRNAKMIDQERIYLQKLPKEKTADYEQMVAVVSSSSTIRVKCITYTVDSRLRGQTLRVRVHDNKLRCYLGTQYVAELIRKYPEKGKRRARQVDYRHVIHSLVKKPQAFRQSRLRDDLLPNDDYRKIWAHIDQNIPDKQACKLIVGMLSIAAKRNCEEELASFVLGLIRENKPLILTDLQSKFEPRKEIVPEVIVTQHVLETYNSLIMQQSTERGMCYEHHDN